MNPDGSCPGHTTTEGKETSPRVSFSSDETGLPAPKVLICLCDFGQEPRSAAVTWNAFRCAGATVEFATERGTMSKAEQRALVRSWFRDALGATKDEIELYHEMVVDDNYLRPHAWSDPSFDFTQFDAVILSTGYDKGFTQYASSQSLHKQLAKYFPLTKRYTELYRRQTKRKSMASTTTTVEPDRLQTYVAEKQEQSLSQMEGPRKVVGAIAKGVLVLVESKYVDDIDPSLRCPNISEEAESNDKLDRINTATDKRSKRHTMIGFSRNLHRSHTITAKELRETRDARLAVKQREETEKMCQRSVLYNVETTTLATWQEKAASTVSKFYGVSGMFSKRGDKKVSEWILQAVRTPQQYVAGPHTTAPWAHVDPNYHYVSGRYPPDSPAFAKMLVREVDQARKDYIRHKHEVMSMRSSSEVGSIDGKQDIHPAPILQSITV